MEVTNFESDCSDVGGQTLPNEAACREAAKELERKFLFSNAWSDYPKGCIYDGNKLVFWNKHGTGAKSKERKAICSGRYSSILCQFRINEKYY